MFYINVFPECCLANIESDVNGALVINVNLTDGNCFRKCLSGASLLENSSTNLIVHSNRLNAAVAAMSSSLKVIKEAVSLVLDAQHVEAL